MSYRSYKVVVLGFDKCGQSALCARFVSGTFVEKYDQTIEDFYRKEIDVNGTPGVIEILDSAETDQFVSMRDLFIKNGQGFLLVYSIVNAQTFIDVQPIRDQIIRVKGGKIQPIVLIGNNCDMEQERSVNIRDGQILASEWGCPFFETSARTGLNVAEAFFEIVHQIININQKQKGGFCCCVLL